jgi:hypothetical protein
MRFEIRMPFNIGGITKVSEESTASILPEDGSSKFL